MGTKRRAFVLGLLLVLVMGLMVPTVERGLELMTVLETGPLALREVSLCEARPQGAVEVVI